MSSSADQCINFHKLRFRRSRIVWLARDLEMDFEGLRISVSIRIVSMEQTRGSSE